MTHINITPASVSLAGWRAIYRGASVTLDPASQDHIIASPAAFSRILAKGEPVYGINCGYGKLASVRIKDEDLGTLQRNIVLSHAAGMGAPIPVPIIGLMIALKLASLSQGASGGRPEACDLLSPMLERCGTPVVPSQGSVGASGDLAPLSHTAVTMIGIGEVYYLDKVMPSAEGLAAAGLAPIERAAKEGLALINGTQFSIANALAGLFEAELLFTNALITGALSTEAAKGSDTPFDPRIHQLRRHAGQSKSPHRCAA